jgi:hypothetical protein
LPLNPTPAAYAQIVRPAEVTIRKPPFPDEHACARYLRHPMSDSSFFAAIGIVGLAPDGAPTGVASPLAAISIVKLILWFFLGRRGRGQPVAILHKCAQEFSPLFTLRARIARHQPDTVIFNDRLSRFSKPRPDNRRTLKPVVNQDAAVLL